MAHKNTHLLSHNFCECRISVLCSISHRTTLGDQLGFMVIQKLDWGRTHIRAHLGCWQNSPPCFCRACGSLFHHSQQESESYLLRIPVVGIT